MRKSPFDTKILLIYDNFLDNVFLGRRVVVSGERHEGRTRKRRTKFRRFQTYLKRDGHKRYTTIQHSTWKLISRGRLVARDFHEYLLAKFVTILDTTVKTRHKTLKRLFNFSFFSALFLSFEFA